MAEYHEVTVTHCSCEAHLPIEAHQLYRQTRDQRFQELIASGYNDNDAIAEATKNALMITIPRYVDIEVNEYRDVRYCCALTLRTGRGDSHSFPSYIGTPEQYVSKTNHQPITNIYNEVHNNTIDKIGESNTVYDMMGDSQEQERPPSSNDEHIEVLDFYRDNNGIPVKVPIIGGGGKVYEVRILRTSEVPII